MSISASLVFISYSQRDLGFVAWLAARFEEAGIRAWYFDRDQVVGEDYISQLRIVIGMATAIVVVVSQHSAGSKSVKDEVLEASERNKRIAGVLLGMSDGDVIFKLRADHLADARNGRNPVPQLLEFLSTQPPLEPSPEAHLYILESYQSLTKPDELHLKIPRYVPPRADIELTICTIGRDDTNSIRIHQPSGKRTVSQLHARICTRFEQDQRWTYLLRDGGDKPSKNGTFIRGQKLPFGQAYILQMG